MTPESCARIYRPSFRENRSIISGTDAAQKLLDRQAQVQQGSCCRQACHCPGAAQSSCRQTRTSAAQNHKNRHVHRHVQGKHRLPHKSIDQTRPGTAQAAVEQMRLETA